MDQASATEFAIGKKGPLYSSVEPSVDQDASVRVETITGEAPHNAVKAEDLSLFAGGRCLLSHTDLKLAEHVRYTEVETPRGGSRVIRGGTCFGLVGPNGCGKSTLLRLLASRNMPVPAAWDVFLVGQHLPLPSDHDAIEEVLSADQKRYQLLSRQATLEAEILAISDCGSEKLVEINKQLSLLADELSVWNNARVEVADLLVALGFQRHENMHDRQQVPTVTTPVSQLSGGWRMKVQLAKALWLQPKLLLLDEPTNHLDYHALIWLQEKLEEYPHTSVVVSHDVSFLHSACQEILWIKDQKLETLPRDMVSQEDLLRMQRRKALNFSFMVPSDDAAENHGLSLHGVKFSYEDGGSSSSDVLLHVKKNVRLSGKSRCVLLGRNGSGKSTFLDLCAGKLCPTTGVVDLTPECKIGHYSQQTYELDRCPEETAAGYLVRQCREALEAKVGMKKRAAESRGRAMSVSLQKRLLEVARGVLSNFGFDGDIAVSVPLWRLSGGQRACLKFAALSLNPVHILLLDEPTNHLDAEACEALAKGLSEFKGGIVAATHDDLLIYRLIQCNWSESELLVCKGGSVERLTDFSAHCLNSLKASLRSAEALELTSKDCPSKKSSKQKMAETPNPKTAEAAPATVIKGQLPPWLQSRRRVNPKTANSSCENLGKENAPAGHDMKPAAQPSGPGSKMSSPGESPAVIAPLKESSQLVKPSISQVMKCSATEKDLNACDTDVSDESEVADTWEALLEDEVESEETTSHIPPSTADANPCTQVDLAAMQQGPGETDDMSMQAGKCIENQSEHANASGSHSRFRKDLLNLNKAVSKWTKQVAKGELTFSQVQRRILDSKAALHLKGVRNESFDAERFVKDVLGHAEKQAFVPSNTTHQ